MIKAIRAAIGVNPKVVSLLEMGFPLANDKMVWDLFGLLENWPRLIFQNDLCLTKCERVM